MNAVRAGALSFKFGHCSCLLLNSGKPWPAALVAWRLFGILWSALDLDDRPVALYDYSGPTVLTWSGSYAGDGELSATYQNGIADQLAPVQYGTPAPPSGGVCQ